VRALAVLLLISGFALCSPSARAADTPSDLPQADRGAIRSVIDGQMGAFHSDDAPAAFAFASPSIQAQFGDAGVFLDMVRRGYQPVYRPRSYAFGPLVEMQGQPVQKVELVGPDGQRGLALYFMQHQSDGSWRINGCVLTASDSVGA
jgi:Domain of unknown function (DUF4864)